jgi:hypothetical protein
MKATAHMHMLLWCLAISQNRARTHLNWRNAAKTKQTQLRRFRDNPTEQGLVDICLGLKSLLELSRSFAKACRIQHDPTFAAIRRAFRNFPANHSLQHQLHSELFFANLSCRGRTVEIRPNNGSAFFEIPLAGLVCWCTNCINLLFALNDDAPRRRGRSRTPQWQIWQQKGAFSQPADWWGNFKCLCHVQWHIEAPDRPDTIFQF